MSLPTPLCRVECYLAKAAGMEGVTLPEKPESRLELYLAKIAGEAVTVPNPLSLKEIWLALICGESINPIPEVQGAMVIGHQKVDVRYLAAAAGVNEGELPVAPQNRAEEYFVKIATDAKRVLKTVTGKSLTLTDVVGGIESLNYYYGDTSQQGTPTPSTPQPVQTVTGRQVITISDGANSQDYEINLGKNLCDGVSQGYYLTSSIQSAGKTTNDSGLAILVEPNTDYTISSNSTQTRYRVGFVNELPQLDNPKAAYGGANKDGTSESVTLNSGAYKYLVVNATNLANIQIEKSSSMTPFAPYFTPVEICKIGERRDYIYQQSGEWWIHKAFNKTTLDGSRGGYNSGGAWYYWSLSNAGLPVSVENGSIMSNCFSGTTKTYMQNNLTADCLCAIADGTDIIIRSLSFSDASAYQNWLNAALPTVYYQLSTPTDTKITNTALIEQLNALNSAVLPKPNASLVITSNDLAGSLQISYWGKP